MIWLQIQSRVRLSFQRRKFLSVMFGFSDRFSSTKDKFAPGPGSYTAALVPSPFATKADLSSKRSLSTFPKDINHTRYSFLNSTIAGDFVVYRAVESRGAPERRGPGSYTGHSLDTFPKQSFNVLAHDSIRHRNKTLQRAMSAQVPSRSTGVARGKPNDSLVMKARQYIGQ